MDEEGGGGDRGREVEKGWVGIVVRVVKGDFGGMREVVGDGEVSGEVEGEGVVEGDEWRKGCGWFEVKGEV